MLIGSQVSGLSDMATVKVPSASAFASRSQALDSGAADIAAAIRSRSRLFKPAPSIVAHSLKAKSCAVFPGRSPPSPHFRIISGELCTIRAAPRLHGQLAAPARLERSRSRGKPVALARQLRGVVICLNSWRFRNGCWCIYSDQQ
jgi:hypothetical protein